MAKKKASSYMTPGEQIAGVVFLMLYLVVLPFATEPLFRLTGRLLDTTISATVQNMIYYYVLFADVNYKITVSDKSTEACRKCAYGYLLIELRKSLYLYLPAVQNPCLLPGFQKRKAIPYIFPLKTGHILKLGRNCIYSH